MDDGQWTMDDVQTKDDGVGDGDKKHKDAKARRIYEFTAEARRAQWIVRIAES
jgi:hypothetical protein